MVHVFHQRGRKKKGGLRQLTMSWSEIGQVVCLVPKIEDGLAEAKRQNKPIVLWLLHLSAVVFLGF